MATKTWKEFLRGILLTKEATSITYNERSKGALYNKNDEAIKAHIDGEDQELITEHSTQTMTNKTLTAPVVTSLDVSDAEFTVQDDTDATKELDFDVDGTTGTKTTLKTSQTTNKTITLPDATDTLVAKDTTDTLTNKTLTAPVITGLGIDEAEFAIQDAVDPTIEIDFDAAGSTGTKTTIKGSQTVNRIITLPDDADTLVGKATSDVLTNKSFDADTNTITNIENADIKVAAAIDAEKLADGTVTNTELQYINSLSSNAQDQIDLKADDSAVVHNTGNENIAGVKTFTDTTESTTKDDGAVVVEGGLGVEKNVNIGGDVVITGDLQVDGTTTTVNTNTLDVEDPNITVNNNGNQATANTNKAGITVEMSDATDVVIGYDSTLASKFKLGESGSEVEIADVSSAQTFTNKSIDADNSTITNLRHGDEVDEPSSGVHGVTGSLVGTSDSQQLTNKDYDGGTASNDNRLTLPSATKSVLDGLSRKAGTFVYATDEKKVYFDNGLTLVLPIDGISYKQNYISNEGAESGIDGWSEFGNSLWTFKEKLTASDTSTLDKFGQSVAMNGNFMVVGADVAGTGGQAYVFKTIDGGVTWVEHDILIASDTASGDRFGISVAINDELVVVGANIDESSTGAAYVFKLDAGGASWSEQQKLTASDAATGDEFGYCVGINGDLISVGAWKEAGVGINRGAAYVFKTSDSGATWTEKQKLTASDITDNYYFGSSICNDGDLIVVGSNTAGTGGQAYVFKTSDSGETWVETEILIASDAAANDRFGYSSSINGNLIAVGAWQEDGAGTDRGAAYVFKTSDAGANWTETQKLTASDAANDDEFGKSISISGDYIVVGAYGDDGAGTDRGAAYVYKTANSGVTWTETDILFASDPENSDFFGSACGCACGGICKIAIGAFGEDGVAGNNNGAVYTYKYTANFSVTRNTTNPLFDDADFLLTANGSQSAGDYIACDFDLDNGDLNKKLNTIMEAYKTDAYTNGWVELLIYDLDAASYITEGNTELQAASSGARFINIQTMHASNTNYELRFVISVTGAGQTFTINADNILVMHEPYQGIDGYVVGTTDSQTMTNKTLTAPTITGLVINDDQFEINDPSDQTKELGFDVAGTTGTKTTVQTSQTTNKTITLPDATDTLVGKNTTDTLTNKTLTSPKINEDVALTSTATELNQLDDVSVGGNTAGDILTTNGVQAVTLKDIDGGTASNTSRMTIPKGTYAAISALTRKAGTILYATDTELFYKDDGVSLAAVGSGTGAGVFSYIDNGDAESNTSGWTASSANFAITRNTTTPLDGDGDFLLTALVGVAENDYIAYDFDLENIDLAKKLSIIVEGIKTSSAYESGFVELKLYDKDNATYVYDGDQTILASTIGMRHEGSQQTHATSTNYELRFRVTAAGAGTAFTMNVDNIKVQREGVNKGIPAFDEEDLNLTLTNFGNAAITEAKYSRLGQRMIASVKITIGSTLPTGTLQVSLDDHTMIDKSCDSLGKATALDVGTDYKIGSVQQHSTSILQFYGGSGNATAWAAATPFTFAQNDIIEINFDVPISGWQSETSMSASRMNRDISIDYKGSSAQGITANVTAIEWTTEVHNTAGGWNGSSFTAMEDGEYDIVGSIYGNAAWTGYAKAYIGSTYAKILSDLSANQIKLISGRVQMKCGEVLTIRSSVNLTLASGVSGAHVISIRKTNTGTEKIAQSEKVYAEYTSAAIQTTTSGALFNINFSTKVEDSHNAVTTGTGVWKFTAPRDDIYEVFCAYRYQTYTGWVLNEYETLYVGKGSYTGTTKVLDEYYLATSDASGSAFQAPRMKGGIKMKLKRGETISFVAYQVSGASLQIINNTAHCFCSIVSCG